jgi:hypothetical protein
MLEPRPLHGIAHPFIDSMYIKKEFDLRNRKRNKDILVIETKHKSNADLLSLLADIDLIKDGVESKAGKINRIDIRY